LGSDERWRKRSRRARASKSGERCGVADEFDFEAMKKKFSRKGAKAQRRKERHRKFGFSFAPFAPLREN
jgi:hypothetical protein